MLANWPCALYCLAVYECPLIASATSRKALTPSRLINFSAKSGLAGFSVPTLVRPPYTVMEEALPLPPL
jgi:hypothetical protein